MGAISTVSVLNHNSFFYSNPEKKTFPPDDCRLLLNGFLSEFLLGNPSVISTGIVLNVALLYFHLLLRRVFRILKKFFQRNHRRFSPGV